MKDHDRGSEWQVFGAVALIVLGALLFLNQAGGTWWGMVRGAFRDAASVAWPLVIIGLGALLLINARQGGVSFGSGGRRLYRSRKERMVGGVLGGLAEYLGGVDPTWLRIAYVVVGVLSGFGPAFVVYIIAMIVIPEEPKEQPQPAEWPQAGAAQAPTWAQQQPGSTETVQTPPPAPPAPPAPPQA